MLKNTTMIALAISAVILFYPTLNFFGAILGVTIAKALGYL